MMGRIPELEVYLRRATRGLWGARRLEVRHELEEHVLEQAWAYECEGLGSHQAILKALEVLGEAQALNAGLVRVHGLPGLARGLVLLVALAGGAVALLSSNPPRVAAIESIEPLMLENLQGLRFADLRHTLEPLGVGLEDQDDHVIVRFPDARGPIRLEVTPDAFVTTPEFVRAVAHAPGALVQLTGWNNPRLSVGTTAFTLGTNDTPVTGYGLYAELLGARIALEEHWRFQGYSVVRFSSEHPETNGYFRHRLRVNATPGTVIAAITMPKQLRADLRFLELDVAPVQPDGTVELYLPQLLVDFAGSMGSLETGGHSVALLQLTGRISARGPEYEVILPEPP